MIGLLLLVSGLSLCGHAVRKYGTELERKRSSAGGQGWRKIWKGRRRFTSETGYRLYITGLQLIVAAIFVAVVIAWNL
jgi:hypothetical protein